MIIRELSFSPDSVSHAYYEWMLPAASGGVEYWRSGGRAGGGGADRPCAAAYSEYAGIVGGLAGAVDGAGV